MILSLLVVLPSSVGAFNFKQKHFQGEYTCAGSGEVAGEPYQWVALLDSDGEGVYTFVETITFSDGSFFASEWIKGTYSVEGDGILILHGSGLEGTAVAVLKGAGILLGRIQPLLSFTGQCWRQK